MMMIIVIDVIDERSKYDFRKKIGHINMIQPHAHTHTVYHLTQSICIRHTEMLGETVLEDIG